MDTYPNVPTVKNILENLLVEGKPLDKTKIDKLLKLKLKSETMFNLKDRDFILEVFGMMDTLNFDTVYNYLKANQNETNREVIVKKSPVYNNSRKRNFLDITKDFRIRKVESHTRCPRCKQYHVDTISKQTRSADEGATDFHRCSDCGYQWKE